ncbi:MAG: pyruvate, phosphate dikinase [Spirochaetales bacterium]|nr:pyruvate, phosphate dikinase [Spirochaetales bacterium]
MIKNVHYFSRNEVPKNIPEVRKIGLRGKEALEFAKLNLPVLPGLIIDADVAGRLDQEEKLETLLKKYFEKFSEKTGKGYGSKDNPLLLKIVVSPSLAISHYPTLHNFGLTHKTIPGFNKFVGENFGYHEVLFLVKGYLEIEAKIAELENNVKTIKAVEAALVSLSKTLKDKTKAADFKKELDKIEKILPEGFFSDSYTQMAIVLKRISYMLSIDELDDDDVALIIQPMVYGNYGKDSAAGYYNTRNVVTGEAKLEGEFFQGKFDSTVSDGKDINKLDKKYIGELAKCAKLVEEHFKEIRTIRFTVENKNVWFIDQRAVMSKSTQADIKTLLDLHSNKIIDDNYLIKAIKPTQLNEILHPVIDYGSTKALKDISGGISGAPGACIGKIYFSTEKLLEEYKLAQQNGLDTRFILCLTASFAEDVKAIEVSTGVLSSEGGYSAHASVVSRQYGKISLVKPDLKLNGNKAQVGGVTLKEGDYITLNVPHFGEPHIYLGQATLIEPKPDSSGLLYYLDIVKKYVKDFNVRVNADKARDAELALKFGADGIGLCRTEHMFFDEKRINVFREMIIAEDSSKRKASLKKLKTMQKKDFKSLFKIMNGKEVTIRLLDAPLHEFLPHNDADFKGFMDYLKSKKDVKVPTPKELKSLFEGLKEFNPMLGHRGCRIAVSYPEIYSMQVEAIFETVYELQKEKVIVKPELMIPLIMNPEELKLIIYGKKIEGFAYKGLMDIEKEVRAAMKAKPVDFKVGTMIELPASALGAGQIARYAQFFSFGTNDLTQTTLGLSRDDYNSFMPDYTLYDIISGNPFSLLDSNVKELISTAVRRGVLTRPDLKKGLCGEHGANPENIKFCMENGLDYVSCSTYSVPIAKLAIAQINLGVSGI